MKKQLGSYFNRNRKVFGGGPDGGLGGCFDSEIFSGIELLANINVLMVARLSSETPVFRDVVRRIGSTVPFVQYNFCHVPG